jgi:hypothetical protein
MLHSIDAMQAEVALRVAEYDRRGLAGDWHALTTSQWLAHTVRVTKSEATRLIRTGGSLGQMPTASRLATEGRITSGAVRKLTAARDRHPDAFELHESVLAETATYLAPRDLRRAIAHWEQQVAYPDAVAEVASRRRRRRLSINQTWDGMYSVSGELDPETGQVVTTALEAHVQSANLDAEDDRTYAQKTADGLADICRYHLDHAEHPATSSGTKPHVTVEVDYDTLIRSDGDERSLPELDGIPVDVETIRRLACDANVVRMVIGPRSEVLDVGRSTRTVPPALRRAVDRRDGGCTWTGCDAPANWCDAHHIHHWAEGGSTDLGNLRLLCRRHHTVTHERGASSGSDPPC